MTEYTNVFGHISDKNYTIFFIGETNHLSNIKNHTTYCFPNKKQDIKRTTHP